MPTKTADSKGRIALGKEFANCPVMIECVGPNEIRIIKAGRKMRIGGVLPPLFGETAGDRPAASTLEPLALLSQGKWLFRWEARVFGV
jgi:hypothetical protein